ncbi:Hint domain-containing protein [Paracoccus sp. SCSIO 75233]|uniref:Hint domain-containing protein n=1 Tax=Paracoccus sp. SCSIO 75233 TaxID=3017782 RepID=UPI0022F0DB63|nr:Hint domain-containing protein [Paracoccus sp. SCSIO 75233]WBU53064.1 Hint domain-containing protein [Paracoccus sp. SCSIO 75233]
MAHIFNIQTFIIRNVLPKNPVGKNDNYRPDQILNVRQTIPGQLERFHFGDGNRDGDLYDAEETHNHPGETGHLGTQVTYDGIAYFVQSMFITSITVHFSDGTSITSNNGARTFVVGRHGTSADPVVKLKGDVIVNPTDTFRTAILNHRDAVPGRKPVAFTVNSFSTQILDNTTMSSQDDVFCFASGTLIETCSGVASVERLSVGDKVRTLDSGFQAIKWIGATRVSGADMAANPKLRPIRIRAGALGQGLPQRDLVVSRQHRVLARSPLVPRMFNTSEILVPAIKLIELDGVEIDRISGGITYWHILFDKHEVIFSEGTPTESLFTGPEVVKGLSPAAQEEIEMLFPQLFKTDFSASPVRQVPDGKRLNHFVLRQCHAGKPLLSGWRDIDAAVAKG